MWHNFALKMRSIKLVCKIPFLAHLVVIRTKQNKILSYKEMSMLWTYWSVAPTFVTTKQATKNILLRTIKQVKVGNNSLRVVTLHLWILSSSQ